MGHNTEKLLGILTANGRTVVIHECDGRYAIAVHNGSNESRQQLGNRLVIREGATIEEAATSIVTALVNWGEKHYP